jgi:hypothetical protein
MDFYFVDISVVQLFGNRTIQILAKRKKTGGMEKIDQQACKKHFLPNA